MNLAQVKNVDIKEKYQESRSIETEEKKTTCKTEREARSSGKAIKEKGRCIK